VSAPAAAGPSADPTAPPSAPAASTATHRNALPRTRIERTPTSAVDRPTGAGPKSGHSKYRSPYAQAPTNLAAATRRTEQRGAQQPSPRQIRR
jgi:hypothetical protein